LLRARWTWCGTETRNTRPPVSNLIMWQFEKQNVPPKLFFLTLFWEFVILADLLCRFPLTTFSKKNWIQKKNSKKIQKKNSKKKSENFPWNFFFQIFLGYHGSTSNLEHACEHLGGLGPLVWEEIENVQTVHKPKLKFIYRLFQLSTSFHYSTAKQFH
jgi:hypothetical protein